MTDDRAGRDPIPEPEWPRAGLELVTAEILPALLARLRAGRLAELEVRSAGWRVRLRRDLTLLPWAGTGGAPHTTTGEIDEPAGSIARSTAVGYFSPAAGLAVGAPVQTGDVLGTIDMLGIAQEVTAPADGVISSVLAEDGQAVEFGQPLAEIDAMVLDVEPEPESPGEPGEEGS